MIKHEMFVEPPLVLANEPAPPEALAAGLVEHQNGHLNKAEEIYNRFLSQSPQHPQGLAFLGALMAQLGNYEAAIPLLRKAIKIAPGFADPRYCLSSVWCALGNTAAAVTPCTFALALGHPKANMRLEYLLELLGTSARAQSAKLLVQYYLSTNQIELALKYSQEVIKWEPMDASNWRLYIRSISNYRFTTAPTSEQLANITHAFNIDDIDYRQLSAPALSALQYDEHITALLQGNITHTDRIKLFREALQTASLVPLSKNKLFNRLLSVAVVNDIRFEKFLTPLREAILWEAIKSPAQSKQYAPYLPLISSLSIQAFINEYVWTMSPEESEAVEQLSETICATVHQHKPVDPYLLAVYGAYSPLYRLPCAKALAKVDWPEPVQDVATIQLLEPLEEIRLQKDIQSLVPLKENISQSVRSQYEENPYPKWTALPTGCNQVSLEEYMQGLLPKLRPEEISQPSHPDILVAGCGTGLIPNDLAISVKNSSIIATDLSLTSLGYAQRKTNELKITSIKYIQGDILDHNLLYRSYF
jgi:tetratricopeptide (TPR) repeat protein